VPVVYEDLESVDKRASLFCALGRYWSHWPLRDGPSPITEVDMLFSAHGWWPWLLTYAVILLVVAYAIYYFMKRRRAG
jgi:hypothetical protein